MISGAPQDQVFSSALRVGGAYSQYLCSSGYLARRSRRVHSKMASARTGLAVPLRMRETIPPPSSARADRASVASGERVLNVAHDFALFIEFEAGVFGVDHSGLQMGLCNALFKFEALHYAGIVVIRFIYARRDRPHLHGARRKGSH